MIARDRAPPETTPQVEPLDTTPPSKPEEALIRTSSLAAIISWAVCTVASEQFHAQNKQWEAFIPQYFFENVVDLLLMIHAVVIDLKTSQRSVFQLGRGRGRGARLTEAIAS
jgi:hypothetical protein